MSNSSNGEHDDTYHGRIQEISAKLAENYLGIAKDFQLRGDNKNTRINTYVFIAHAAVITLSLNYITGHYDEYTKIIAKIYFTLSTISILILSIDLAVTAVLMYREQSHYLKLSQNVHEAANESPPRLLIDGDESDKKERVNYEKFYIFGKISAIILSIELLSYVIIVWSM